jgi:hypothetical protein
MLAVMKTKRRRGTNVGKLRTRNGQSVEVVHGPPLDPALQAPSMEEVLASVDRLTDPGNWEAAGPLVMPIFQRARPHVFAHDEGELVTVELPPGVNGGFWNRPGNRLRPGQPEDARDDGYMMKALQPPGAWGSALLLLPDELERIFGSAPQIFIAPIRAMLPDFVDRATVAFFADELESLDPNALHLEGFVLRDHSLAIEPLPRAILLPSENAARA